MTLLAPCCPPDPGPSDVRRRRWRSVRICGAEHRAQPARGVGHLAGPEGAEMALSGPNGGGKNTWLRLVAGALSPIGGKVEARPGRIAYLPQNPTALLHRPTLRSEVSLTLERAGESEPPEAILKELGLLAVAGRYPRDLSCGERQRAAPAAVLPGPPRLLLLDAPTRGVDAAARASLVKLVSPLND